MSVLFKLIYRFNVIPIKITAQIFVDIDMLILKFVWKAQASEQLKQFEKEE